MGHANGNMTGSFTVPDPFVADDPAAVCPPTADQLSDIGMCALVVVDSTGNGDAIQLSYGPPPPTYTGMASTPDGKGYWLVTSDGHVSALGDAAFFGGANTLNLNAPISHIVSTPDGTGYWLVAADGGTFAYGDAGFYGSMGNLTLNAPVIDIAPTKDGKGYWLVASDGGIFAFGDADFHGSMGGRPLNKPIVGMDADNATGGYWLVAADGGIFAFDAPFFGSTGGIGLNRPVNGMTATANDLGYLFVASDGGIFAFGDAVFYGSAGNLVLNAPIVGMATDSGTGGYWLLGADGGVFGFNAQFYGAGQPLSGPSISGTVTALTGGAPLPGATVSIYRPMGPVIATTTTDANGTYQVAGLSVLTADNVCFTDTGYVSQCYGGVSPLLVPPPATGIDAAMEADGAISGTVTDTSDGAPVAGVAVTLYVGGDALSTTSASNGTYGFSDLHPGWSSQVCFSPPAPYIAQCYNGASSIGGATSVPVTSGVTTTGINAALVASGTISGRVTDQTTGDPLANVTVDAYGVGSSQGLGDMAMTAADGTYEVTGLLPGTYQVCFQGNLLSSECYGGTVRTTLTITPGKVIAGINASLTMVG